MCRKDPVCSGHAHGHSMGMLVVVSRACILSLIMQLNHVLASMGTGFHESVKQCKSFRCWEVKLSQHLRLLHCLYHT